MPIDLLELSGLSHAELLARAQADPRWFEDVQQQFHDAVQDDQRATQLAYYRTANPMALPVHLSTAREIAVVGGNRSAKTTTMLADLAIQLTGHIPLSLMAVYPRQKVRPPIRARLVCNSLTDTLEPVIKPKLRWDQWNGTDDPESGRGLWGLIPRHCLVGGTWEKAYSEKYRTLHVAVDTFWQGPHGEVCRTSGVSKVSFLSYDQELSAFTGASLHWIGHDELPPADIYRENRMRTLDVQGQVVTGFTPPDEIGIARADVVWFYDEVYERGLPGPDKHPRIDTITLYTEANTVLNAADIAALAARMTEAQREVRLHGKFLHLTGVVYALFTVYEAWWCFRCARRVLPLAGVCGHCRGDDLGPFCHVIEPFPVPPTWPVVFIIDPHPRKKDAMGWFAVAPSDDLYLIGELETDGTATEVAREVRGWEEAHHVHPVRRLMDPNIATETNDKLGRGWTLRRAYDEVGLRCDLATDDVIVGIENVQDLLKPDARTRAPRFRAFRTCPRFIHGMTHWSYDEWARPGDREPKESVRDKLKDFPDLIRYLANDRPTFAGLTMGRTLRHRPSGRSRRGG